MNTRYFVTLTCMLLLGCTGAETAPVLESVDCPEAGSEQVLAMAKHGVALRACPVHSEVEFGQPIEVKVALQNVSDTTVTITPHLYLGSWLDAEIVGPDDRLREPELLVNPPDTSTQVVLGPGEAVERIVDLRCPFGPTVVDPDEPGTCLPMYSFEEEGVYRIQLRYSYLCRGQGCPTGDFEVNEVRAVPFTVRVRGRT